MEKKMRGMGILLILVSIFFGANGCAVVGVGAVGAAAGGGVYLHGELSQAFSVPMEKAWNAAQDVVAEMQMNVTEKSIDHQDRNRVLKGKTKEKEDFQIHLEAKDKDVTTIKVRIGLFGDQEKSQKILDAMGQKMKG